MGEGGAVARGLEDLHRPLRALLGGVGLARHEQVARQAHEALPVRDRVAEPLVEVGGGAAGVDRLAEAVGVVELPPVVVEHAGALARFEPVDVRQQRLEVRERLTVGPGLGRLAGGGGADRDDRVGVAGLDRVVHQPCAVRRLLAAQGRDHRRVELLAADRRQALLDRAARELVAEGDAVGAHLEHAGALGLGERLEAASEQGDHEVQPYVGGHHRQLVERLAARGPEPADAGEHRLHHADRHHLAGRGEHLGHEERVAAGDAVDGGRVGAGPGREERHRVARQRPQRQAVERSAGEHPEEALVGHVVADVSTSTAETLSIRRAA